MLQKNIKTKKETYFNVCFTEGQLELLEKLLRGQMGFEDIYGALGQADRCENHSHEESD